MEPLSEVLIYTAGVTIPNNPGKGGAGVVLISPVHEHVRTFGRYLGEGITSNAAELLAAVEALTALTRPCAVTLVTSSQYLAYTMSKGWIRNVNNDLWNMLDHVAGPHVVTWRWIKSRTGDEYNDLAYYYAAEAAKTMEDVTDAA